MRRDFIKSNVAAVCMAVLAAGMAASGPAEADDPNSPAHAEQTKFWSMARGGQLYDNWAEVLEVKLPSETHPSYPATGKQKGGTTWRCKECHGWDYRGVDGAYATGSHFTGIKGIRGMANADPASIVKVIRDKTHGYTPAMLSDSAVEKLALFVSLGQIDDDLFIDRKTRKANGDAAHGAPLFQTICAVCHNFEGKALNFGSEADPEFVGTVAVENPWEFLHKARFGQPGVAMVGLVALDLQNVVDILTYAQTLPEK